MTVETEFADALAIIASGLGLAAERIFGIFVESQQIAGILELVAVGVAIIIAYLICRTAYPTLEQLFKNSDGEWEDESSMFIIYLITAILGGVVFMLSNAILGDIVVPSIMRIACPEYMAAKEIIRLVIS